jgi:hypothetical protein
MISFIFTVPSANFWRLRWQRLERRPAALRREDQLLVDAYQAGVLELDDLRERRARLTE